MGTKRLMPRLSPAEIVRSLGDFRGLKVLVVGDLFLDEYIEGEMFEISKEGPIPVVRLESRARTAGAAGNLASSIRNLGASVSVAAVVGRDANGKELLLQLRRKGIRVAGVLVHPRKPTLTYTKVRARVENTPSREILRMDVLPDAPLDRGIERRLLAAIRREARGADGIIVLDQVHHVVSKRVLGALPRIAHASGALLHGSSREHIAGFRGFNLITPNDREAQAAVGGSDVDPARPGRALRENGKHEKVMLTLGEDGMVLIERGRSIVRIPTYAREVLDVTGAGDAVSSVAMLGNILGWDIVTLGWTASQAAAIAVEHVGTHHVSLEELKQRILEEGTE